MSDKVADVMADMRSAPSFARRTIGATGQIHSSEQILITAILVVEVVAG